MERWGKSPPVSRVTGTSCKLYPKQHRPGGYGLLGQSPNRWHRDGQQCPPKIDGCRPQNPAYRRTAGAPFSGRFFLLFRRKTRCFFELLRQRPGKNHLFAPLDCRRGQSFPPGGGFFAFFEEKSSFSGKCAPLVPRRRTNWPQFCQGVHKSFTGKSLKSQESFRYNI